MHGSYCNVGIIVSRCRIAQRWLCGLGNQQSGRCGLVLSRADFVKVQKPKSNSLNFGVIDSSVSQQLAPEIVEAEGGTTNDVW